MKYTKNEINKIVHDEDVRFIRLQFTDIFGSMKNVSITPSQLEKALDNKIRFDGSSIDGFVRIEESDMALYPDLDSFAIHPWGQERGKVARLICDVYKIDGKPFEGDPRYVLRKALAHASDMGYEFNVGPECEFYLLKNDEKGNPTLDAYDKGGYFDLGPNDLGEEARKDIVQALEALGFVIEASHHECGPAQHEIDFMYAEALQAADSIMTFKYAVKTVSEQHDLYATFMPKPISNEAGNGMHLNMSLSKNGKNAFIDDKDKNGLSKEAYSFMAGIMRHIEGISIVTNPLVNSYKRLVPDFEAPVYIAWSAQNRSPLIRVPSSRGQSTRIELRSPDPSANPYLSLALCLEAGLEGIQKEMVPPASIDKNIFEMSRRELTRSGVKKLPANLFEAISKVEKDPFIAHVLGSHIYDRYVEAKKREWNEYSMCVSDWEIDNYLFKY
ncbi:MAG: type I glutamate--ammonia ligase [Lachnospiraceae bacterium]|nr:type I glutamate--ammonia ligase [Lachnospiraceae bacterium]MBR3360153.1 type I glutamate--ammonia ligase [Lachnospiraceae bacterium]